MLQDVTICKLFSKTETNLVVVNFYCYTVRQYSQIFHYPTNALSIQIIYLLKTH